METTKERGDESDTGMSTAQEETPAIITKTVSTLEFVDNKPVFKPGRDFLLAFIALCTLTLAVAFDATTLSVALPQISVALNGTALEAFWSGTSFLLATTVFQPTLASLSNIFGRKYLIYFSGVLFAAGSIIGALAGNFTVIIAGRTVQGVGGGGIIALTELVVTDLTPLAVRGQWFSLLSAMWAIGSVTGPLIGAGFSQNVTWRWLFWINLPIIGLGFLFVVLFLHQAKIPGGMRQKLGRFDWFGSALFTAAMTAFLFGISTGGVMHPWGSYQVLLPLLLGFAGLVAFGHYEFRWAREPIINKKIFNNRDMILAYCQTVLHGIILWSLLYFLTLYYQGVKLYSPVTSAVAVLPETVTVAPAAMAVGIVASVTGRYRWSLWVGWVLTVLGAGIMWLLEPATTVPQWVFLNLPIGIGTGMLFPAITLSIQAACEPALNGQASAFFSFLRGLGQAIGVAISGVVFQNVFRTKLEVLPAFAAVADEYSRDATIVIGVIKAMPEGEEKRDLIQAYADSLRIIWVSLLAFSALAMFLSFGTKGYSLNQEHVTEQGLVQRTKVVEPGEVEAGKGEKKASA